MRDDVPIQPLGYFSPSPHRLKFVEDDEGRRWRYRRILYCAGLGFWFIAIAFYFGPNVINFGKLTRLSPDDFVGIVQRDCVPTVRAMKEYQRDHGKLPTQNEDLAPRYLPEAPKGFISMERGHFQCLTMWNHFVIYDFTPGAEGWSVRGPFANGQIRAPLVTPESATYPATRPG